MEPTYQALIHPIPPLNNLSNIAFTAAVTPCSRCCTLIPARSLSTSPSAPIPVDYNLIDHYPSFPLLKVSSKSCGVCKFIRKSIRAQWAVRPMEEWGAGPLREGDGIWDDLLDTKWDGEVKIGQAICSVEEGGAGMVSSLSLEFGPVRTTVKGPDGEDVRYGDIGQVIGFKVFDSRDMGAENGEKRRRLPSPESLSSENLNMVNKLIHDCKTSHPKCRLPRSSAWLPTRLLDVWPESPRLVNTATDNVSGSYVALSHMWGSPTQAPPLRTLTSNIEQMRGGIEMWKLPRNFREAVVVTRKLGVRYVWIDSLCIIQDSGEDWRVEAKTMHQVYKFAEITVVATSATCSHDGFLKRDLSMIPAVKYTYPSSEGLSEGGTIILSSHNGESADTWIGDIESIPWNKRGWTMQERSLSMRLLHFGATKLYFECRTCLKSEENEPLNPERRMFRMWPLDAHEEAANRDRWDEREEEIYERWRRAVTEYSQRGLTKGFDKLTAIASVAAEMSSAVQDRYLEFAGIWTKKLRIELLWHVRDGLTSTPWEYRAPSWSWAALDAKIGWHEIVVKKSDKHEVLQEAKLEVRERSGELKNVLKMLGVIQPISRIEECDSDDRWLYGEKGNFPYDMYISTGTSMQHFPLNSPSTEGEHTEEKFLEGRLDLDDKDSLTRSNKFLGYVHVNSNCRPSGLVLERIKETESVWKRVGVATMFDNDGNAFSWESFSGKDEIGEILVV